MTYNNPYRQLIKIIWEFYKVFEKPQINRSQIKKAEPLDFLFQQIGFAFLRSYAKKFYLATVSRNHPNQLTTQPEAQWPYFTKLF